LAEPGQTDHTLGDSSVPATPTVSIPRKRRTRRPSTTRSFARAKAGLADADVSLEGPKVDQSPCHDVGGHAAGVLCAHAAVSGDSMSELPSSVVSLIADVSQVGAEPGPCERRTLTETKIDNSVKFGARDYVKLVGGNKMRIQIPAAYNRFGTPWSSWDMCIDDKRGASSIGDRIAPGLARKCKKESDEALGIHR
jgi:hypothetical protein